MAHDFSLAPAASAVLQVFLASPPRRRLVGRQWIVTTLEGQRWRITDLGPRGGWRMEYCPVLIITGWAPAINLPRHTPRNIISNNQEPPNERI